MATLASPASGGTPSKWVSYIVTTVPTAAAPTVVGLTRPSTDNTGTLVDNKDGSYVCLDCGRELVPLNFEGETERQDFVAHAQSAGKDFLHIPIVPVDTWSLFNLPLLDIPVVQTNSIDMKLVLIPAGEFKMGSPAPDEGRQRNDRRQAERMSKPGPGFPPDLPDPLAPDDGQDGDDNPGGETADVRAIGKKAMCLSYFHQVARPGSERKAFFCLTTLASSCQSSDNGSGTLSRNCRWQSAEEMHGDHTLFHQSKGRLRQKFDLFSLGGLLGRAWLPGAAGG